LGADDLERCALFDDSLDRRVRSGECQVSLARNDRAFGDDIRTAGNVIEIKAFFSIKTLVGRNKIAAEFRVIDPGRLKVERRIGIGKVAAAPISPRKRRRSKAIFIETSFWC